MTTQVAYGPYINSSDDAYRGWVGRVINLWKAAGLVQTDDTGQIDVATATRPTANTVGGYAILRFNDSAQATHPLFLRIEFGTGTGATVPRMQVFVGKGTDGAGVLEGLLFTSVLAERTNTTSTSATWWATGGEGYAAVLPCVVAPEHQSLGGMPYIIVERSPDSSSILVVENTGYSNLTLSSIYHGEAPRCNAITYASGLNTSGVVPVALPNRIAGAPLVGGTPLAAASLAPVFPWVLFAPSQAPWQSRSCITYPGGDGPKAAFEVTLNNEEYTFAPVPLSSGYNSFGVSIDPVQTTASRHIGLAVRWE